MRLARSIFPFPFPAHHARTHARTQSCHANPISRITTVLPIKKTHLSLLIDQYTHPLLHPGRLRLRLLRNTQLVRGSFDGGGFFFLERSFFSFSPHTTTSRVAHGGLGAPEFVPEFARCRKAGCAAAAKETPDCVFS